MFVELNAFSIRSGRIRKARDRRVKATIGQWMKRLVNVTQFLIDEDTGQLRHALSANNNDAVRASGAQGDGGCQEASLRVAHAHEEL